jgi:hypothetical protein
VQMNRSFSTGYFAFYESPRALPQAEHEAAPLAIGEKQRRFAERPPNYFINRAERLRLISRVILR